MSTNTFRLEFRVDYADTDAMGVVYHGSYFRWLERARVEWLRDQGLSYRSMEEKGLILPLKGAEIAYKRPLRFDDTAEVLLKVTELGPCTVDISYEIFCRGKLTTTASTSHVLCRKTVDKENGEAGLKPVALPKDWRERWEQLKEHKS